MYVKIDCHLTTSDLSLLNFEINECMNVGLLIKLAQARLLFPLNQIYYIPNQCYVSDY